MAENISLVISLDYGTTFTGVGFCEVRPESSEQEAQDIVVITNWRKRGTQKVPSEYSYSPSPLGANLQWGWDIAPGSLKLVHTKLELDTQSRVIELQLIQKALNSIENLDISHIVHCDGLPPYPSKNPVEIIADYLSHIRRQLSTTMHSVYHNLQFLNSMPKDLVITIPAVWSEVAKDRTFAAVSKAGFNAQHFPGLRRMYMVSEADAAALHTVKEVLQVTEDDDFEPGDCFVQCDVGGGTADLIAYQLRSKSLPDVREFTIGTGGRCGGSLVNLEFRKWLEDKLGPRDFQTLTQSPPGQSIGSHTVIEQTLQPIMDRFETLKQLYRGDGVSDEGYIPLPQPLSEIDDPTRSIVDGEIRLTDTDFRQLFRPCIDQIIKLIAGQIIQVEAKGSKVKYVFLSGGFSLSAFLQHEIREFLRVRRIALKVPDTAWSAVIRGAVQWGIRSINTNVPSVRPCKRSYGITISQAFSDFKHSQADEYTDPHDGEKKARQQIYWLIKKGDRLMSNAPRRASIDLCRRFGTSDVRVFETKLYSCSSDDAPGRLGDNRNALTEVASLSYDFSGIASNQLRAVRAGRTGQPYYCVYFNLELEIGQTLKLRAARNGEVLNSTEVACDA